MKLATSTLLALVGAFAGAEAAVSCPEAAGAINFWATMTSGTIDPAAATADAKALAGCFCPSGTLGAWNGANYECTAPTSYPQQCGTTADGSGNYPIPAARPGETSLKVSVAANGNFDTTGSDVTFTLALPISGTRKFKKVGFTAAPVNNVAVTLADSSPCLAGGANGFKKIEYPASFGAACNDMWAITIPFANMRACGLTRDDAATLADNTYEIYTGNIHLEMEETVTLGNADTGVDFSSPVVRTLVTDYPVVLKFESNKLAVMDASSTSVFTDYQVDFAITGQNIKADDFTNIKAGIRYTVQYPYAIRSFEPIEIPQNQALTAEIDAIDICDYAANDYVLIAGSQSRQCTKDNVLTFKTVGANNPFNTAEECKFTGYTYTLPFTVQCGEGIADTDCPLLTADAANTATFTITSDNFCTSLSYSENINGVITITSFESVIGADAAKTVAPHAAYKYGETIVMRMQFSGLDIQDLGLTMLERRYDTTEQGTAGDANGASWVEVGATGDRDTLASLSNVTPGQGEVSNLAFAETSTVNGIQLGLKKRNSIDAANSYPAGDEYRFSVFIGTELLGGLTATEASVIPARGEDRFLRLRGTIDVSYNTGRRRRRQASATGGGRIESSTQTIAAPETTEAAAAPNSAVRAAPAVALVLALLSAVALL